MKRLLLPALLLPAFLLLTGCDDTSRRCEQVCAKMLGACSWQAWKSVDQCAAGCEEELYRRSDADEVLDCYDAALEPLSRDEAEAEVTRALDAGLFQDQVDAGGFSFEQAVQARVESSTCDLFATIQCRVNESSASPSLPLAD